MHRSVMGRGSKAGSVAVACHALIDKGLKTVQVFGSQSDIL